MCMLSIEISMAFFNSANLSGASLLIHAMLWYFKKIFAFWLSLLAVDYKQ